MIRTLIAPLTICAALCATAAQANPIERACLQSDRPAATRAVCACVGEAAERTLTSSDMRLGARFFRDPEEAQRVQLSDSPRNEEIWTRWRAFGELAEAMCR
jgi:hypothetical protein